MNKLSFDPDPSMAWLYDPQHPEYHSPRAQSLRDARDRAVAQCPAWMKHEAHVTDVVKAKAQP